MKYKLKIFSLFILTLVVLPGFIWMLFTGKIAQALTPSSSDQIVYDDSLASGWHNWSWNTAVDLGSSDAQAGAKAIAASINAWGGLYLHSDNAIPSTNAESIVFSMKPTQDNSTFIVLLYDENNAPINAQLLTTFGSKPESNAWNDYIVPIPANRSVKGIAIQESSGKPNKVFLDGVFIKKKANANSASSAASPSHANTIYSEGLANGWENWSWNSSINVASNWPVSSGNKSLAYSPNSPWAGLYLHTNSNIDTSGATHLQFKFYATQANQKFALAIVNEYYQMTSDPVALEVQPAGTWKTYTIPLSDLGANNKRINGIVIQEIKGEPQTTVYIDDMVLISQAIGEAQQATNNTNPTPTVAQAKTGNPPTSKQFTTLAPGSNLPSGETCAGLVKRSSWEPRPENYDANNKKGFQLNTRIDGANAAGNQKYLSRINGDFTGTTDEIIQWGACKWGLDEDVVRAVAAQESWWRQTTLGDWNGSDHESYGLLQVRKTYHAGTYPIARESVPFNVDYALGWRRACMDGYFDWIPAESKGDEWGCVGLWFSGRWKDGDQNVAYSGANWYIKQVQGYLNSKVWLSQDFPTK